MLYRNLAGARFADVTSPPGSTADARWGSGCSFLDYDRDGDLDLFVANYLRFDLATAAEPGQGANCVWKGVPVNCGPKGLPTDTNLFYRNNGDGTFSDVSAASRIASVTGRYPMTALAADLDEDGWTDIYVASDSTAAILYRNNRDGTFTDVALQSGTAFSEQGNPQAGMGVGARRRQRRWPARPAQDALRRRHSRALSRRSAAVSSRTWRCRPVSACRTATSNGAPGCPTSTTTAGRTRCTSPATSIRKSSASCRSTRTAAREWSSATPAADGSTTSRPRAADAHAPRSSRGAAFGDIDNDGDIDVLVMNMNEPPSLLRNDYRGPITG